MTESQRPAIAALLLVGALVAVLVSIWFVRRPAPTPPATPGANAQKFDPNSP